ncbi:MAG: AAA family ATPase [Solirubrobacteraceae bacterium]
MTDGEPNRELVGREAELGAMRDFLLGRRAPNAGLLLEGPAGIGKTSLLRGAVEIARAHGRRVLIARPSDSESGLGLAGLTDLFEDVPLDGLAPPRRRALESALLLREAEPDGARAVNAAVRDLLRELAARRATVVAIDDLQWLDHATGAALAFAARRLGDDDVRFLLAARTPRRGRVPLETALEIETITVAPLSFGAVQSLVHGQLGVRLSRSVMRRIHDAAAGNPLFALELARELARTGELVNAPEDIPLPTRVEELLEGRLIALADDARAALLAVALGPGMRREELQAVVGADAIEAAVAADVLGFDGARARLSHPLLGEVAKGRVRPRQRRELHRRLADAVSDTERRALHRALAADGPDGPLAATVAAAAIHAERRGMIVRAGELAEHALRLTPADDSERDARLLEAARHADATGRLVRSGELLRPVVDQLAPGEPRARAMVLLSDAAGTSTAETHDLLERAIDEAPMDSPLRAHVLCRLAVYLGMACVEDVERALVAAAEAVRIAERTEAAVAQEEARAMLVWMRAMRGLPVDAEPGPEPLRTLFSRWRSVGVHRMWRGELHEARRLFEAARTLSAERGEAEAYVALRLQLCELEMRRGDWEAVAALVDEWEREHDESANSASALARCRAALAAGRGDHQAAVRFAQSAIAAARASGAACWQELEALRALGVARLLAGEPGRAAGSLQEAWDRARAAGVQNPGTFPIAPDLVAALVATGVHEQARAVTEDLSEQAARQNHPWGRAASALARGLVLTAEGDDGSAAAALSDAWERFEELDMPFAAARCMLALGAALRRRRRLREARETLALAVAAFDRLGSPGWAEAARAEATRVGGRRPAGGGLTATEARVARLVAEGRANKEVAAELVITVGAVESHLTRIFAKLGVRSRTQLARRLAGAAPTGADQSVGGFPLPDGGSAAY